VNVQIITSSYPAFEGDSGGTAGLFVQSLAHELVSLGHRVIVQPVERKKSYQAKPGIVIEPIPWEGGDQELASMNFLNPLNLLIFLKFFLKGKKHVLATYKKYDVHRVLCMWVVPSGIFGYWIKKRFARSYDVWALGSDIWKVRKIPFWGDYWIKKIVQNASGVYADGQELAEDVKAIAQKDCVFLPSSRKLPEPAGHLPPLSPPDACHILFVGRYHKNKGPDLLIEAINQIPENNRKRLKVHLFGTGPLEAHLRSLCAQFKLQDVITINGPIDGQEFANYLSLASFLAIPSRIESIPLVFSDAMQGKTPVISTPVGNLPDLIKEYQCGLVCDALSATALAETIQAAMVLSRNHFGQEQFSKAYAPFDIQEIAQRWLSPLKNTTNSFFDS